MRKTIISILGADIRQEAGVWRTNDLTMLDKNPLKSIDSFRTAAGAVLALRDPEALVLVQGGWGGYQDATRPSIAEVMKQELVGLGVAATRIHMDEESQKTLSQLLYLQATVAREQPEHVCVVTNAWHVPRVQAFLQHFEKLASLQKRSPMVVAAEEVLSAAAPDVWNVRIAHAARHLWMPQVVEAEKTGMGQILDGTYRFE